MKTNIFILLLFSLSFSSCDFFYFNVAIDGDGFKKSFDFECGKVEVLCGTLADTQLSIEFNFKLDSPILVNPEKLKISYNNEPIEPEIHLSCSLEKEPRKNCKDKDVGIAIIIRPKMQAGDTIKINVDNFIFCKDKPLEIGDVNLVLVSRK